MREYSPADGADHADEYSKLYYFAEKDRLFEVKAVLSFGGGVCVICERLMGSISLVIFGTTTHYFHQLFGEYKPFDYLCTAKIGANAPKVAVR